MDVLSNDTDLNFASDDSANPAAASMQTIILADEY